MSRSGYHRREQNLQARGRIVRETKDTSFSSKQSAPSDFVSSRNFSSRSQSRFSPFFRLFSGAFRLYDVDNDGFITRDEMYNIVDAIYQMVVSTSISNYFLSFPRFPRGSFRNAKRFVARPRLSWALMRFSYQWLSYNFLKITISALLASSKFDDIINSLSIIFLQSRICCSTKWENRTIQGWEITHYL